jgi:hypothetical protein
MDGKSNTSLAIFQEYSKRGIPVWNGADFNGINKGLPI